MSILGLYTAREVESAYQRGRAVGCQVILGQLVNLLQDQLGELGLGGRSSMVVAGKSVDELAKAIRELVTENGRLQRSLITARANSSYLRSTCQSLQKEWDECEGRVVDLKRRNAVTESLLQRDDQKRDALRQEYEVRFTALRAELAQVEKLVVQYERRFQQMQR